MYVETSKGRLPVKYTVNAIADFEDMTDQTYEQFVRMKNKKASDWLKLILVGLTEGARVAGEEPKVKTYKEVGDLVEEDPGFMPKMVEALAAMGQVDDKKK